MYWTNEIRRCIMGFNQTVVPLSQPSQKEFFMISKSKEYMTNTNPTKNDFWPKLGITDHEKIDLPENQERQPRWVLKVGDLEIAVILTKAIDEKGRVIPDTYGCVDIMLNRSHRALVFRKAGAPDLVSGNHGHMVAAEGRIATIGLVLDNLAEAYWNGEEPDQG
jgi:hypothetical protein